MYAPLITQFEHELIFTALIAILGAVAMWPIKLVKKSYEDAMEKLEEVHSELVAQRTNHLSHIEASNEKQVELLGKVAETLEAIHLDQARLLGKLDR
jgi:hypothetical protein